MFSVIIVI